MMVKNKRRQFLECDSVTSECVRVALVAFMSRFAAINYYGCIRHYAHAIKIYISNILNSQNYDLFCFPDNDLIIY
jgi:hypothetical protein